MVGDWLAQSQVATSVTDPQVVTDLTALGAVFTLLVQPSGRYTAISEGFGPHFGEERSISTSTERQRRARSGGC